MTEILNSGNLIPILAIVLTFGFLIVSSLAALWYKHQKSETLAALKQDMLDRGMSAEEIRTVLESGDKH